MRDMEKDMGCFNVIKVPEENLINYKEYNHGIIFVWGDQTDGGCWSGLFCSLIFFINKINVQIYFTCFSSFLPIHMVSETCLTHCLK